MRCQGRGESALSDAHEHEYRRDDGCHATVQPARRTDADEVTHDKPKIEATRMNQEALQDIRVAAQMRTAHAPVS